MTLTELHDWVFDDLGLCGCGDPESALDFLRDTLNDLSKEFDERWPAMRERFPDNGISWAYLYLLDDKGLTEHGSNIMGCWLTDEGEAIRVGLNTYSSSQILDYEAAIPSDLDAEFISE